jgi:hypothetical protein
MPESGWLMGQVCLIDKQLFISALHSAGAEMAHF